MPNVHHIALHFTLYTKLAVADDFDFGCDSLSQLHLLNKNKKQQQKMSTILTI